MVSPLFILGCCSPVICVRVDIVSMRAHACACTQVYTHNNHSTPTHSHSKHTPTPSPTHLHVLLTSPRGQCGWSPCNKAISFLTRIAVSTKPRDLNKLMLLSHTGLVCLLFYILVTSKVISGWVLTRDRAHS